MNKTIFEDDFRRPTDPTYAILKMVEDIYKYSHHPLKTHQYDTILLAGKDLKRGGLSLIVTEHTRIPWV
jgi:hypothetical protein